MKITVRIGKILHSYVFIEFVDKIKVLWRSQFFQSFKKVMVESRQGLNRQFNISWQIIYPHPQLSLTAVKHSLPEGQLSKHLQDLHSLERHSRSLRGLSTIKDLNVARFLTVGEPTLAAVIPRRLHVSIMADTPGHPWSFTPDYSMI